MKSLFFLFFVLLLYSCDTSDLNFDVQEFLNRGEISHQMDIYTTADLDGPLAPVLFLVHGGGWCQSDKSTITAEQCYFFVRNGYVVVNSNYSLSPYPWELDNPDRLTMNTSLNDLAGNLKWVCDSIKYYGGDGQKIYLVGHSAGAQLSALLAIDQTYLQQKGVEVTNIKAVCCLDGGPYMSRVDLMDNPDLKSLKYNWINAVGSDNLKDWRIYIPSECIHPDCYYPNFLQIYSPKKYRSLPNVELANKLSDYTTVEQYVYGWEHLDFWNRLGLQEWKLFNEQIISFGFNI